MVRKKGKIPRVLTGAELAIMKAIWEVGPCNVREVQEVLAKDRKLAYTSVATIMKILEQKAFLKSRKGEKTHVYTALTSRAEYEIASLKHLSENVFEGNSTFMVMRLLDDSKLSKQELESVLELLNEKLTVE